MQFLICLILHGELLLQFQGSTRRHIVRRDSFGRRGVHQGAWTGIYVDPNYYLEPTQVIKNIHNISIGTGLSCSFHFGC